MFRKFNEVEIFFEERKRYGVKPGLDRVFYMLKNMQHPEKSIHGIHIAGTNGKGSTAELIKYGLLENGYDVGLFTSPSFHGLCGHIFINNKMISEKDFVSLLNEIYPIIEKLDDEEQYPTEFEIITVIGFLYFKEKATISIIEAGMGGREDTTNCFTPILSIITSIALDHIQFLGTTVEQIASHKAGILKFERPVIIGVLEKKALNVIDKEANLLNCKIYKLGTDFNYSDVTTNQIEQIFHWKMSTKYYIEEHDVKIQMLGSHQLKNASLAVAGLSVLKDIGFKIKEKDYLKGMEKASLPGRFEVVQKNPVIILDGAHNPDGVKSFVQSAQKIANKRKTHIVFACFKDKDIQGMLNELKNQFTTVTLTNFEHTRSYRDSELIDEATKYNFEYELDWRTIVDRMIFEKNEKNICYFITGSLYFIFQVKNYIEAKRLLSS